MSKKQVLEEAGLLPLWRLRASEGTPARRPEGGDDGENKNPLAAAGSKQKVAVADSDWATLEATVKACQRCRLCEQRKQAVFGVGDRQPTWLFVGEGPGAEEDRLGEPFVGQAGRLLDQIFAALGLSRQRGVYIANAVKCRPPENRKPTDDEMDACFPYLKQQIEWLSPDIIVALGASGAQTLLRTTATIGSLRGRVHHYEGIPLIATYHPAYLLRSPMEKAKVWRDLVFAIRTLKQRA